MEASKCPKCGDEPHFVDQVEKWYCYGCNSYVEEEEHRAVEDHPKALPLEVKASEIARELEALDDDNAPTCSVCGATLEKVQGDRLFCFVCECSPEGSASTRAASEAKSASNNNDAQAILDSITVATPVEPRPVSASVPVTPNRTELHVEIKMCTTCGQPLKYIEKYRRHYCYSCRKYAPRPASDKQSTPTKPEVQTTKKCPECGKEMKYIDKYSEFYCHACKKYPLREPKRSDDLKCPKCGRPLRLIEKYSRHYCMACKEYAPKGYGQGPDKNKICPCCNGNMSWVSEYNEWYCYKCKKYSLRPSKPALLI